MGDLDEVAESRSRRVQAETPIRGCPSHRRFLASWSGAIVTNMSGESVDSSDSSVIDRLYEIAEAQGGFLAAHQAVAAGIPRSTLSYHATEGDALERVGHGVYRMRRFPAPPYGHVIAGWLALARADGVVSHESALELLDLTDLIADEVDITLPRAKRGLHTPPGVHIHFTDRLIDRRARRLVLGIPVTSVERTVADLLRSGGWTEQTDLAVRQAIRRGLTTRRRLEGELPAKWRSRLDGAIGRDAT
jgi:predicted transcriptional regulator of viral defense system